MPDGTERAIDMANMSLVEDGAPAPAAQQIR
jgi:hypothetical protein